MIDRLHNIRAGTQQVEKMVQTIAAASCRPLPLAGEAPTVQAAEAAGSVWPVKMFRGNNSHVFSHDVQACIGI